MYKKILKLALNFILNNFLINKTREKILSSNLLVRKKIEKRRKKKIDMKNNNKNVS